MKSILIVGLMVSSGLNNAFAQASQETPGADLIVHDAKIFAGNPAQPSASAVAVKNGRIYTFRS